MACHPKLVVRNRGLKQGQHSKTYTKDITKKDDRLPNKKKKKFVKRRKECDDDVEKKTEEKDTV